MANRSKERGTRYESAVVRYLREGLEDERPERLALHGSKDIGDIGHIFAHGYQGIAECKSHRRVTPGDVAEWRRQTLDERENGDSDFALLVVNQYNRPMGQSLVHVTIRDLARICLGMRVATTPKLSELYDSQWVVMSLDDAIYLMRGV